MARATRADAVRLCVILACAIKLLWALFDATRVRLKGPAEQRGMRAAGQKAAGLVTVRARPGRISALSVSHSKSGLYGVFFMGAQGA